MNLYSAKIFLFYLKQRQSNVQNSKFYLNFNKIFSQKLPKFLIYIF